MGASSAKDISWSGHLVAFQSAGKRGGGVVEVSVCTVDPTALTHACRFDSMGLLDKRVLYVFTCLWSFNSTAVSGSNECVPNSSERVPPEWQDNMTRVPYPPLAGGYRACWKKHSS